VPNTDEGEKPFTLGQNLVIPPGHENFSVTTRPQKFDNPHGNTSETDSQNLEDLTNNERPITGDETDKNESPK